MAMTTVTDHPKGQMGLYKPVTAPFGLHGLPSYFQMQMSTHVLNGIDTVGREGFIDDVILLPTSRHCWCRGG